MVTTLVAAAGGVTHAKAAEPAALADEIEYLVDKYAIDESEAAARIEMQWYLPQFAESLRSDFSATFGGSWIDHATGEVVASFTHQPDRGAIAERFEFPGRVSVRQVQWTFDELVAGAQSLALARPPNAPGYGVRVDASRNVVQVLTGGLSRSELPSEPLDDLASMVEISNASLVAYADDCSRTSCDPPLRGGVKISTGPCSGGFVAADTIEPPANSFYLLTAGHCADAGDVVRQDTPTLGNGRVVGVVTSSHNSGGVDAAAIAVGSTFLPADTFGEGLGFWDPSRWVVHDNNTLAFQIRNKVSLVVGAAEGTVVCRSGWKSTDCGEIVSAASFPTLGDAIGCFFGCILGAHMMFLETDLCSIGGDSGGPVYTRHTNNGVPWTTAFGIHSRSQNSGNTSCPVAEHSFHTHIAFAERSLAVNVWCAQRCGNV